MKRSELIKMFTEKYLSWLNSKSLRELKAFNVRLYEQSLNAYDNESLEVKALAELDLDVTIKEEK